MLLNKEHKYHSALKYALDATKASEQAWTGLKLSNAYQIIGDLYSKIDNNDKAHYYMNEALLICKEKGYTRSEASILEKMGNIQRHLGKHDLALEYYLQSLPTFEAKKDFPRVISNYSNLAISMMQLNRLKDAKMYLDKATNLISEIKFDGNLTGYLGAMGKYHLQTNDLAKSEDEYQKMLTISSKLDASETILAAYQGLEKTAERKKDWSNAYKYAMLSRDLSSEKGIDKQKNLIYDLQSKYEAELNKSEINRLNTEKKLKDVIISEQNHYLQFLIIGLLLALLAAWSFFNAYRIKKRMNNELVTLLANNKMLVKEIHHRVKNNLQVVSSLLNIQTRFEKDDSVIKAINTGKFRVQSMSILHQNLYLNEDLTHVKIKDYFSDLVTSLLEGYPLQGKKVKLQLEVEDIELDVDTLIPLGLIANELVTNSLKHVFMKEKDADQLHFSITSKDDKIRMIIKDNGPGLSFDELPQRPKTMGMQLIQSFTSKLKAKLEIDNFNGCEIKITFDKPIITQNIQNAAS